MNNDKPRQLREILGSIQSRTTAGAAAWRQHVEKNARIGESWEEASERLRREKKAARANPTPEHEKKEAETPAQMFLPGMQEVMRAMPNHIARSSLFAPVARGRKKTYTDRLLVSRSDAEIRFWGEQLDEAQADVWMQIMHEAMRQPLGEVIFINRADFLRSIGRHTGNYEYKWLYRTLKALSFAMLVIIVKGKNGKNRLTIGKTQKHALHMINGFDHDEETGAYTLHIDPRWRFLYENREFALIDWEKRLQFGLRQDLAKALQRLISSSSDKVQKYELSWLKEKMEYSGRMRDFRVSLSTACEELLRLEIISEWGLGDSKRGYEQLAIFLPEKEPR